MVVVQIYRNLYNRVAANNERQSRETSNEREVVDAGGWPCKRMLGCGVTCRRFYKSEEGGWGRKEKKSKTKRLADMLWMRAMMQASGERASTRHQPGSSSGERQRPQARNKEQGPRATITRGSGNRGGVEHRQSRQIVDRGSGPPVYFSSLFLPVATIAVLLHCSAVPDTGTTRPCRAPQRKRRLPMMQLAGDIDLIFFLIDVLIAVSGCSCQCLWQLSVW